MIMCTTDISYANKTLTDDHETRLSSPKTTRDFDSKVIVIFR